MKHFVLFSLMSFITYVAAAQITYRTVVSGNFDNTATWSGGAAGTPPTGTPLAAATCNCKIVVSANTSLTINTDVYLSNAKFVLDGANSQLLFSGGSDLSLVGANSAIDIQNTSAKIFSNNPNTFIRIATSAPLTEVFRGNFTSFNANGAQGTVQGLASVTASNPQWVNVVLPVVLSDFKVANKGNSIQLSWKTELEINSSHFEIQRSADSKEWSTLGSVNASGTVSVEQSYAYTDAAPAQGTNYYRLKIVDNDAKYEYSPIKSVSFTVTSLSVVSSPNPASSILNVSVSQPGNEPYRLRLINRSGQVVYDQKHAAGNSTITVNISSFAEGTYFLETTNTSGGRQINKVMIVHK
jgi:hypothetical protein